MNTPSKLDMVREISAKLTVHENMVTHLTHVLEELISSAPPAVEPVQPKPAATPPKVVPAKPRKAPKKTKKSKAAPAPAEKITGAMMETKRKILLRLSHTKPQILTQIREAVGHDFYTVKKALVALEREKLVKSLSVKNKLGKQSVAYTLTQKS